MMKKYLIITTLFILFSCQQKERKVTTNSSDSILTEKDSVKKINSNEQVADTIHLLEKDAKGNYAAIGSIDSVHSHIYVKFITEKTGNLKASVSPYVGEGNIRFNQIIFPDKTMDGPFGKELQLQLNTTGVYQLIVGRSLMADNPYQGKFKVEVQISPIAK